MTKTTAYPERIKAGFAMLSGAALVMCAGMLSVKPAYAISELEELMGGPMAALSNQELGELRGGFKTIDGVKLNIGASVSRRVNGKLARKSYYAMDKNGVGGANYALKPQEMMITGTSKGDVTELVIEGAKSVGQSVVSIASSSTNDKEAPSSMTFSTPVQAGSEKNAADVGSAVASALAGLGATPDIQTIDTNNGSYMVDTVINVDVGNYSMISAMATSSRVENALSTMVNSQILYSLSKF
jgi:hypothetical protein